MYISKIDSVRRRYGWPRKKLYEGRIKATRGLHNIRNPKEKAMTHRIVRRKLQREDIREIADL